MEAKRRILNDTACQRLRSASRRKIKPALPDRTVIAVYCGSARKARYLAGLLNSAPVCATAAAYIVLHPSPHVLQQIAVPRFNEKRTSHMRIADLSREGPLAAAKGESEGVAVLEAELDRAAAQLWDITESELRTIQDALTEITAGHRESDLDAVLNDETS